MKIYNTLDEYIDEGCKLIKNKRQRDKAACFIEKCVKEQQSVYSLYIDDYETILLCTLRHLGDPRELVKNMKKTKDKFSNDGKGHRIFKRLESTIEGFLSAFNTAA